MATSLLVGMRLSAYHISPRPASRMDRQEGRRSRQLPCGQEFATHGFLQAPPQPAPHWVLGTNPTRVPLSHPMPPMQDHTVPLAYSCRPHQHSMPQAPPSSGTLLKTGTKSWPSRYLPCSRLLTSNQQEGSRFLGIRLPVRFVHTPSLNQQGPSLV